MKRVKIKNLKKGKVYTVTQGTNSKYTFYVDVDSPEIGRESVYCLQYLNRTGVFENMTKSTFRVGGSLISSYFEDYGYEEVEDQNVIDIITEFARTKVALTPAQQKKFLNNNNAKKQSIATLDDISTMLEEYEKKLQSVE